METLVPSSSTPAGRFLLLNEIKTPVFPINYMGSSSFSLDFPNFSLKKNAKKF